jgi:hypothetical protein
MPIAWAIGADVHVGSLDQKFMESLEQIRKTLKKWHPRLSFNTKIHVDKIIKNTAKNQRTGILFSGGIDSTTSYFRHKHKNPILIMIWGVDIPLTEKKFWFKVKSTYKKVMIREKTEIRFVKTNTRQCFNEATLTRDFARYLNASSWWGGYSYGITTLGLTAPLTQKEQIGIQIIASGSNITKKPYGSHHLIDEKLAWANTKIVNDTKELSRREKIKYLSKIIEKKEFPLRLCYSQYEKFNCNKCRKCLRATLNLIIDGVDPNKVGFKIKEDFFEQMKKFLIENNNKRVGKNITYPSIFLWRSIQENLPETLNHNLYNAKEFIKWFKTFNFKVSSLNHIRLDPTMITLYYKVYCRLPEKNRKLLTILKDFCNAHTNSM